MSYWRRHSCYKIPPPSQKFNGTYPIKIRQYLLSKISGWHRWMLKIPIFIVLLHILRINAPYCAKCNSVCFFAMFKSISLLWLQLSLGIKASVLAYAIDFSNFLTIMNNMIVKYLLSLCVTVKYFPISILLQWL